MTDVWGGSWGTSWGTSWAEAAEAEVTLPVKKFFVTPRRVRGVNRFIAYEDGVELVQFDYRAWAQENGDVSSVTWTVEDGQVAISSETLSANVAQAKFTTTERGGSLVKIKAVSSGGTDIQFVRVMCRAPNRFVDDYGMCA